MAGAPLALFARTPPATISPLAAAILATVEAGLFKGADETLLSLDVTAAAFKLSVGVDTEESLSESLKSTALASVS